MITRKVFKSTMLALCGAFIIGISSGTAQAGVAEESLIAQPQIETADTSDLLADTNPQMQQMQRGYGPPPPPPRHRYGPPPPPPRHHHGPPPPPRHGHHWPPPPPPPPPPPRW